MKRKSTDRQMVLRKFPRACVERTAKSFVVYSMRGPFASYLGSGDTRSAAWSAAAQKHIP
jgi:hypothetical protein